MDNEKIVTNLIITGTSGAAMYTFKLKMTKDQFSAISAFCNFLESQTDIDDVPNMLLTPHECKTYDLENYEG